MVTRLMLMFLSMVMSATVLGAAEQRQAPHPDDAEAIRAQLAALPQTGGNGTANARCGGIVTILAGDIAITRPIVVPDGAIIRGQGGNTRIVNRGTGPAFVFHSPYGATNGLNLGAAIEDLMVYSDTGSGVSCDESVIALEGAHLKNVTFNTQGPAIDLRPRSRCYFTVLDNVAVTGTQGTYAIRIDGVATSLHNVRVHGAPRPNFATPEGMVILSGSAEITGAAGRYEGSWPCPYIAIRPYKGDNGAMWPSTLTWLGGHFEPSGVKPDGSSVRPGGIVGDLQDCTVYGLYVPFTVPESPWRVRGNVEFKTMIPVPENGLVKATGPG